MMMIVFGGPILGFRVVMGVSAAMLPSQVPGCRMYKSQGQVGMIGVLACKGVCIQQQHTAPIRHA